LEHWLTLIACFPFAEGRQIWLSANNFFFENFLFSVFILFEEKTFPLLRAARSGSRQRAFFFKKKSYFLFLFFLKKIRFVEGHTHSTR